MKVVFDSKQKGRKIINIDGGEAFVFNGNCYIRLVSSRDLPPSQDSTYAMQLENGVVHKLPDDTWVTPVEAEVHLK